MFVIMLLKKLVAFVLRLPSLLLHLIFDVFKYIKTKEYKKFNMWGIHIYLGSFGACKTSNMVADAYNLAVRYKDLTILTNLDLYNFPMHTKILKLENINDILEAPEPCLVLIDEIGTIFNSRDFKQNKKGEEALPKILFQHLCQCRHRHLMIYGTAQDWEDIDVQIRRKVATVRKCNGLFAHPFTRYMSYTKYIGKEYDKKVNNINYPLTPIGYKARIQTNKIRGLFDTKEMVNTLLKMKYDSDEQIVANTGIGSIFSDFTPLDKKGQRQLKKRSKSVI